jgi:2-keto-4-pentenoate hydratase
VLSAVESLHTAIELPDSRFVQVSTAGAPQLIADNACGHEFVLGPATSADWRTMDLAQLRVNGYELSQLGICLQAGQVVTTGTCLKPMPVAPGDTVAADFGVLGKVTVSFGE